MIQSQNFSAPEKHPYTSESVAVHSSISYTSLSGVSPSGTGPSTQLQSRVGSLVKHIQEK